MLVSVSDRYEIRSKIAQGGVGAVYRGYDHELKRDVAIKRLLPPDESEIDAGDGEASLIAFERETAALSSLQHPNIVSVFDAGVDEDGPFVIMELIDGETLDDAVVKGALDQEDFLQFSRQCLEALEAAQSKNLLHRDLKPANIMVYWLPSGEFVAKILDFGLAKFCEKPALQTIDQGDSILGSIYFLAPEQFERIPLDPRTDIYSLGCVFYYSLTQNYPFTGESAAGVMDSHLNHRVTPLQELRADLPEGLCKWVMRLSSRMMDDRPVNASQALKELQTLLANDFAAPDDWEVKPAIINDPKPVPAAVVAAEAKPEPASPPTTATSSAKLITGAIPTKPANKHTGSAKLITGVVPTVASGATTGITTRRSSLTAPTNTTTIQPLPREEPRIGMWIVIGLLATGLIFTIIALTGGDSSEPKEKAPIPETAPKAAATPPASPPTPPPKESVLPVPPTLPASEHLFAHFTATSGLITEESKNKPPKPGDKLRAWLPVQGQNLGVKFNPGAENTNVPVVASPSADSLKFSKNASLILRPKKGENLFGQQGMTVAYRIRREKAEDGGRFTSARSAKEQSSLYGTIDAKSNRMHTDIKVAKDKTVRLTSPLPVNTWVVWVAAWDRGNGEMRTVVLTEPEKEPVSDQKSIRKNGPLPKFTALRMGTLPPKNADEKNVPSFQGLISAAAVYRTPLSMDDMKALAKALSSGQSR